MNATVFRQSFFPASLFAGIVLFTIAVPLAALHAKSVDSLQQSSHPTPSLAEQLGLPSGLGGVVTLGAGLASVAIAGYGQVRRKSAGVDEAVVVLKSYSPDQSFSFPTPLEKVKGGQFL
ncbi:MAG: hypothetical protein HC881_18070 [Leptolyngbyaceae cyanobacterium SL_7_1]|nr:hypothetical protein [Leptolyngbyaceae cyanobacterium SL_7_1]